MDDRLTQETAGQNQSRREKWIGDDPVEGSARGGVAVPPKAHSSSNVETSQPVPCRTGRALANAEGSWCRARGRRWPPGVQPGPGNGGSRNARKQSLAASGGHPSLDWRQRPEVQRLQADHAARLQESANFQLGGPEKLTGEHDPQHALQKSGCLADQWYMDDGIMCHPILVLPFLQDFDVANARVGAERNPLKTEVICYVSDLNAAPPEWRVGAELGQNLCSYRRQHHTWSRCWGRGSSSRTNS